MYSSARRFALALTTLMLLGCSPTFDGDGSASRALLYERDKILQTDRIAIFAPGVLASIDIFDRASGWEDLGYATVYLRLPGLDGLPADHRLEIERSGTLIAQLANDFPDHDIVLVGYSTGGPIVLTAATQITRDRDIAVALIAPAAPRGGGLQTRLTGFYDILEATTRAGSLRISDVWPEYWRTLLFGRENVTDPEFSERIELLFAQEQDNIVLPSPRLASLHTDDLQTWTIPDDFDLSDVRIAMFVGQDDPVFSLSQSLDLARQIGLRQIYAYSDQGHLIFLSQDSLFDDILRFFVIP